MTGDRAEEALAEAAVYRPDFKSNSVSEEQIHKLQQLRQRRLQIQRAQPSPPSRERKHKKKTKTKQEEDSAPIDVASSNSGFLNKGEEESAEHKKAAAASRKRQKLHWGLDVKQRWERKGNM